MAPVFGYQYPSATNPFVPAFDAKGTGNIIVNYSRDPKKYIVNKLVTLTSRRLPSGYYMRFDPSVHTRVTDTNESVFVDGQPFPTGDHNKQRFQFIPYSTVRHARPYYVGYDEKRNAVYDSDAQAQDVLGNMMMTERNVDFFGLIQNAANYLTANTATATAAGGGKWSAATGTNPYIKIGLNAAERVIIKATNGVITRKDLTLLLSPTVAHAISETQEIREALVRSVYALPEIRGGEPNQNQGYNLPPELYGYQVAVAPDIQNTAARDASPTYRFFAGEDEAVILARPGALENTGTFATAFSSVHMFSYDEYEMRMNTFDEYWNYRYRHEVMDQREFQFVSPESAFLFTDVL